MYVVCTVVTSARTDIYTYILHILYIHIYMYIYIEREIHIYREGYRYVYNLAKSIKNII